jgi:hypothetical protein
MEHPIPSSTGQGIPSHLIPSIEIDDVDLHKQSTHTHVARFEHFLFWSWFRTSILLDLSPLACRLQGPTCQNITASHPPSPASDELVFFPPTTKLIPAPTTKTPNSLVSTVLTTTRNPTRETQGKLRKRFSFFSVFPASSGFLGEWNYGTTENRKTVFRALVYVTARCDCRDVSVTRFSFVGSLAEMCVCDVSQQPSSDTDSCLSRCVILLVSRVFRSFRSSVMLSGMMEFGETSSF